MIELLAEIEKDAKAIGMNTDTKDIDDGGVGVKAIVKHYAFLFPSLLIKWQI